MSLKQKRKFQKFTLKNIIFSAFAFFAFLYLTLFYYLYIPVNKSYAKEATAEIEEETVKISNAERTDIEQILNQNAKESEFVEYIQEEQPLEFLTKYKTNKKIPKGVSYVVQEGRNGTQKITTKKTYNENGELISEEQVSAKVTKASYDQVVEIGGASYSSNYEVKKGDIVYVTSDTLSLRLEQSDDSEKMRTLQEGEQLKVLEKTDNWFKVSYENISGWIKQECTTYIDPNAEQENAKKQVAEKSKQQLLSTLSFNMSLNKPSGLTLEQFKKVLTDSKDTNKTFSENAEFFYYIERQYNINGVFVASIGIHESNWGTSKIAVQKHNLFGYGAYDSNPYNGAYQFSSYSESIDLIARVLVKYYLNPKGKAIYGGETAAGTYYNGATLSGVNSRYATDKNWANCVYKYMTMLYNRV